MSTQIERLRAAIAEYRAAEKNLHAELMADPRSDAYEGAYCRRAVAISNLLVDADVIVMMADGGALAAAVGEKVPA